MDRDTNTTATKTTKEVTVNNDNRHEEAIRILNTIKGCIDIRFGIDMDYEPEYNEPSGEWKIDLRSWNAFTPRPGVEDDDWPDFTALDEIVAIAKDAVEGHGYEVASVHASEKCYFQVRIK